MNIREILDYEYWQWVEPKELEQHIEEWEQEDEEELSVFGRNFILQAAAHSTDPKVIEVITDYFGEIDVDYDDDYRGPLHYAAMFNDNPKMITTLLKNKWVKVSVDDVDKNDRTPLHLAARQAINPKVVEALLKARSDVNARDDDGSTPLHLAAAHQSQYFVIRALVDAGADVNARDDDDKFPVDYVSDNPSRLSGDADLYRLLEPTRRDSYRGGVGRTRLDRTRRTRRPSLDRRGRRYYR